MLQPVCHVYLVMVGIALGHVDELLQELRLSIRRIEINDRPWTRNAIELFNNESIRTVAACREALAEARNEAQQRENETGGNDRTETLVEVVQAERELEHVRMELRQAITQRKRREERRYDKDNYAALLRTEVDGSGRTRRRLHSGEGGDASGSAAGQAREMKQSLQRTRKMMAEQLARVAQVSEVMGEQDTLLMNTFAQHQGIGGSLKRAGTTLTRLKAAEVMDTVIMVASTFIFIATVCFVVYQRVPLLGLL